MDDIKTKVIHSSLLKICSQAVNFCLRLGSVMILARLLDPKDFGLVAMATVVVGVFSLFKDAGLSAATIQWDTISHRQMSTLFWLDVLIGLVLSIGLITIAPIVANFYHEPRLTWVMTALAADLLLVGATAQHSALVLWWLLQWPCKAGITGHWLVKCLRFLALMLFAPG
jgi:O-antigen/teichoic acid export membrane protein